MDLNAQLPEPRLSMVYRLEGALGEPLEIGDVGTEHRRIIRLDGGTVTRPEINGKDIVLRTSTQSIPRPATSTG